MQADDYLNECSSRRNIYPGLLVTSDVLFDSYRLHVIADRVFRAVNQPNQITKTDASMQEEKKEGTATHRGRHTHTYSVHEMYTDQASITCIIDSYCAFSVEHCNSRPLYTCSTCRPRTVGRHAIISSRSSATHWRRVTIIITIELSNWWSHRARNDLRYDQLFYSTSLALLLLMHVTWLLQCAIHIERNKDNSLRMRISDPLAD